MPEYPDSVFVEGDTAEWKSYVVERLLNKRVRRTGRGDGKIVEYLVQWRGYGPEFDTWYNVNALDNCMDLVHEYEAELHGAQSQEASPPSVPAPRQATIPAPTGASKAIAVVLPQATSPSKRSQKPSMKRATMPKAIKAPVLPKPSVIGPNMSQKASKEPPTERAIAVMIPKRLPDLPNTVPPIQASKLLPEASNNAMKPAVAPPQPNLPPLRRSQRLLAN